MSIVGKSSKSLEKIIAFDEAAFIEQCESISRGEGGALCEGHIL